jgi:membrane-bound metal-dependent hydrolase YbcI (DUF457 family)
MVLGVIGGEAPDWIDFHSGLRRPVRIRHRGASHALPLLLVLAAIFAVALTAGSSLLATATGLSVEISTDVVAVLTLAFSLGYLSHLASDACTYGGIQPLLPFGKVKIWLLPRAIRSRSDGYLDVLAKLAGFSVLGFALVLVAMRLVAAW